MRLYINIDHVATIRQARRADEPDPAEAAWLCEAHGADGITAHLREDRRHIQDADVERLAAGVRTVLNLELATSAPIVELACRLRPFQVTMVPERREEVTTEGGEAYHQHSGRTSKVVVLLDDPGTVRFRVATTNVGKLPKATVLQVAGADNGLRASLAGYDVRVERVEAEKGGAGEEGGRRSRACYGRLLVLAACQRR